MKITSYGYSPGADPGFQLKGLNKSKDCAKLGKQLWGVQFVKNQDFKANE